MHLTDCFAPLISYLVHFQRNAKESLLRADQLRAEIDHLLEQGEALAEREGVKEGYLAARFAVCAWGDEIILNSAWVERHEWPKEDLQRHYYGRSDDGEEFFERLKDLSLLEQDVREVYYLCLSLGFTGRYCGPGAEEALTKLRSAELKVLTGSSSSGPADERDLFPGGYPQDLPADGKDAGRSFLRALPPFPVLAIPLLFFVVLFVVFRVALGGMTETLLKRVPF
ncbi:DotU family type IV/VI secretion system protein [Geomonas sp. RF6]|uniref:DotU family type IV/VI secretion system protein n=1 Tax=Geomonas sp. RF6 TaxID=2897342 RepID=UPI001E5A704B|nr:DotU family type IV/VI secretion system protein [Geomonas sp. RF6]UFS69188.1 DotU family type IV/VI secretion system protein [Geomonas sp. RF6]